MDQRDAILAAGRRLASRGLILASEGNLSVRLNDSRILITPSGRPKDQLAAEDLVVVGVDPAAPIPGSVRGIRPSSDLAIHRSIYAVRPDVAAIVHAHLPASLALTIVGRVPDPGLLPETVHFLPRLPFVPYGQPGSDELALRIAAALADGVEPPAGAVLLERHGAIAVGGDLGEALDRIELVDLLCRVWRDVLVLGGDPAVDPGRR
jgi:L-fuculose-phosphate aldolase